MEDRAGPTPPDWGAEIVRLVRIKQAIAEADTAGLWEHHLPRVAASPEAVSGVERLLGVRLDPDYGEFLGFADGWPSFFQSVDLFGVAELAGGAPMDAVRELVTALEPAVLERAGLAGARLLPVAGTAVDLDVFVTAVRDGVQVPPVVWLAGGEIDRFASFRDFFAAMVAYNLRELRALTDS